MDGWKQIVQSWYPDLHSKTYCVPPCIMNRLPYVRTYVAGQPVLTTQLPTGHDLCGEDTSTPPDSSVKSQGGVGMSAVGNIPKGKKPGPSGKLRKSGLQSTPMHMSTDMNKPKPVHTSTDMNKPSPIHCTAGSPCEASDEGAGTGADLPTDDSSQTEFTPRSMWEREPHPHDDLKAVHYSDTREDFSQQHVLTCLQKFGEENHEAMFIISQLEFTNYLKSQPPVEDTSELLPRPADLADNFKRGDFDILVIHRQHGILVGEIKSVGLNEADLNKPVANSDADLAKRVQRAVKQLEKSELVMKHMISDVARDVSVRKTLILPYIASGQLLRVLSSDPKLGQAVCKCVGAPDCASAVDLCLCSDQLSDRNTPWLVDTAVLTQLDNWWRRRMGCGCFNVHCAVSPRVEVRTVGEAVSELGRRLALLVLTPPQLDLLTRAPPTVCLTGPPGTGKSLVLVIQGLVWLREGHDVVVLSTRDFSFAVSVLIYHQLRITLEAEAVPGAGVVHFHHFDLWHRPDDVELAVQTVAAVSGQGKQLHVLMDEAEFRDSPSGPASQRLVRELKARVQRLCLWAASVGNSHIPPQLQEEPLTVPIRCAPAVQREVEPSIRRYSDIHSYTASSTPSPSDGPSVIRLRHEGAGHVGHWPVECVRCGQEIASLLRQLHVGAADSGNATTGPPPLQCRDVMLVTRSSELREEAHDDTGRVTSPASGVVRGLRASGIPVGVAGWISTEGVDRWERYVTDMAIGQSDHVTVAAVGAVDGLERKVVVYLPGRWQSYDDGRSEEEVEAQDRLWLASRCTTQLVMVDMPQSN